jgi:hypothetical protein
MLYSSSGIGAGVAMWLSSNRPKKRWPSSEHELAVKRDANTEGGHMPLEDGCQPAAPLSRRAEAVREVGDNEGETGLEGHSPPPRNIQRQFPKK